MSEAQEQLLLERQVYSLWCRIGKENSLTSHSQIAVFLIQCYQASGDGGSLSGKRCLKCDMPLVQLCLTCDPLQHQCQQQQLEKQQQLSSPQIPNTADGGISPSNTIKTNLLQETMNMNAFDDLRDFTSVILNTDHKIELSGTHERKPDIKSGARSRLCVEDRKQDVPHEHTAVLSDDLPDNVDVEEVSTKLEENDSVLKSDVQLQHWHTSKETELEFENKIAATAKDVNGKKQYYCQDCDLTFPAHARMRLHMQQHLNYYPHSCDSCGATFFQRFQLYMHTLNKHPSLAKTLFVGVGTREIHKENMNWEDSLEERDRNDDIHISDVFDDDKVINQASDEEKTINQNEENEMNHAKRDIVEKGVEDSEIWVNNRKVFSCIDCGQKFTCRSRMKRHFQIHINYRPYSCLECQARFHSNYHLQRHLKSMHTVLAKANHVISKEWSQEVDIRMEGEEKSDQEMKSIEGSMIVVNGVNSFSCKQCGQTYSQRHSLVRHIHKHTNNRKYPCKRCGGTFLRLSHLKMHVIRKHQTVRPFVCSLCSASFTDNYHLKRHEVTHTKHRPVKCTECDAAFSNTRQLKNHLKTHIAVDEKVLSMKVQSSENSLLSDNADISRSDQDTGKVDKNSTVVSSYFGTENSQASMDIPAIDLKEEPLSSHPCSSKDLPSDSECQISDAPKVTDCLSRNREADLSRKTHAAVRSSKRKGKPVKRCRNWFSYSQSFDSMVVDSSSVSQRHTCTCEEDRDHVCETCAPDAPKAPLEELELDKKPFVCKDCGQAFAQHSHLVKHARQHSGERPYICSVCGMAFIEPSHLKRHSRKHTGDKPFMCEQCGAVFVQSGELKTHIMAMHTKVRPYQCDQCNKAYTTSSLLRVHKRSHTGERPYICATCGAAFKIISHLKDHNLIHTGEKPKQCSLCPNAYTRISHLKRHIKRAHPGWDPALAIKSI